MDEVGLAGGLPVLDGDVLDRGFGLGGSSSSSPMTNPSSTTHWSGGKKEMNKSSWGIDVCRGSGLREDGGLVVGIG